MSPSALRADGRRNFVGADHKIRVADAVTTRTDGEERHDGLLFTVEVEAADAYQAIRSARPLAARVADQLSLVHACAIDEPVPLFCLSLEPQGQSLTLAQVIRDVPALRRFRRPFRDEVMGPLFTLIDTVGSAETRSKLLPRIDRALRYLRRSYLEQDPIDRFEDLSDGLQALEPRLREKYSTATTYQRTCESCEQPLACSACGEAATAPDSFSGVDYLVTTVLQRSEADARRLRRKRNDIVHARAKFAELLTDLDEITELATEALVAGVLELVGAEQPIRDEMNRPHLPLFNQPELLVVVELHDATRETLEQQASYPAVRLKFIEAAVPNRQVHDTDPDEVHALVLYVDVENWSGEWEPIEALLTMPRDPSDNSAPPELLLQKSPS